MVSQPAWQTEELQDEWPDEFEDVSEHNTRSISLTIPVGSLHHPAHSGTDPSQDTDVADVLGTFLIRRDAPTGLLQKTPAQRKGLIKDFFSPIALERMFDPPSPGISVLPSPNPSGHNDPSCQLQSSAVQALSVSSPMGGQEGLAIDHSGAGHWRPDMSCRFTFSVPHPVPVPHTPSPSLIQDKNATGAAAAVMLTDPPLRLFQFQYDTFTRDHLSAMVDSIAINSPSDSNAGNPVANTSSPFGLPPVSEASAHTSSIELRSAKRVKLSPASDFHGSKNHTSYGVRRPVCRIKDYVGESRFLMAQIKNAKHSPTPTSTGTSAACPNSDDNLPRENQCESILVRVTSSY